MSSIGLGAHVAECMELLEEARESLLGLSGDAPEKDRESAGRLVEHHEWVLEEWQNKKATDSSAAGEFLLPLSPPPHPPLPPSTCCLLFCHTRGSTHRLSFWHH